MTELTTEELRALQSAAKEMRFEQAEFVWLAAKAFYQRKWIPVSKGLPEKSGNYFVTYCVPISKREDVTSLYWNGSEWVFLRNWRGKVVLSILAWKPMPQSFREPYKEPTP